MPLSRLKNILPSPTLEMTRKALEMKASGCDVLMLAAGEPDFATPDFIIDAAQKAMCSGETRYTAVDGTPQLKKAIIDKFRCENALQYSSHEIIVSAGGKQVVSNALLATVQKGDEVLIPAPYWVSYPQLVSLCEGTPIVIPTKEEQRYRLEARDLEKAITAQTKWLILNSPCNPTGAVFSESDLRAIADVLMRHPQISILTDDIYESIIYDGKGFKNILNVEPALCDRTLIVNGVSKSHNMTGWRLGYGAGPAPLIKTMAEIQGHLSGNACSISQAAAVAALTGPQEFKVEQLHQFQERRDIVVSRLNAIKGISCRKPEGAFYVFPSCAGLIGALKPDGRPLETDKDVTTYFLEAEGLAVVHGGAFGMSPNFRISYAASMETLVEACDRIERSVACLRMIGTIV